MGSDSGAIGVEVTGLHGTGRTISGRSAGGEAAAKGLKEGLHTAGGSIGHFVVRSAVTSFVSDEVVEPANKLPVQLADGGVNVSNVASTARESDNDGAAALSSPIADSSGFSARINRQV
ncbi:MAG: hypothetical protein QOJ72_3001 [Nocardioidaceae bacterium]|nr:hypothetical protein [Nocardioidaceae bacterium]